VRVTIALVGEEVTEVRGKRHTLEQVVWKLGEAERLQAEGADVDAVCRHVEVSVQTFQRWRAQ
jgi:putative transposase